MIDKLTAKKIMKHPATIVAILYVLTNLVYWGCLSDSGIMPVIGEMFALFFTGGVNAALIVLCSCCPEFRTWGGGTLLTLLALGLFAFLPLCIEINRVLPTDAQAGLAMVFWGGAATVAYAALTGAIAIIVRLLFRKR
jgi:hypothetical protein